MTDFLRGLFLYLNKKVNIGLEYKGRGGETMEQGRRELLDSLVDIRQVKIDRTLPVEERMKSYVEQIRNPYLFKVGDTVVRVSYANTQATINDNFLNLLASM